jgi:4-amino-4-deoxy-L-arabinose transferase-like glycosyltransferase
LLGLLAGTAVLYLWDLGASGYGNSFYAAAVQAGTISWKAMFFGSLDASNYITVDKPPASLWLMALSGRIFGFGSWSLLVPDALCGVATVAVLSATVRRLAGPAAGLLAGLICALTPVAALMFRFDNPDALLVLTMTVGAYFLTRAVLAGSWRWIGLAGLALGFGFLTKMLQAFLVLPAFALAYLVAAPPKPLRRIVHVLVGGLGVVVGAGWWVAVVALTPASARPYVGGSQDDSELGLAFGYNGVSRIFGGGNRGGGAVRAAGAALERGAAGGGALRPAAGTALGDSSGFPGFPGGGRGGGGFGGSTGIGRMFSQSFGAQISWLIPAALILLAGGLWVTRRAPRTDPARAGLVLWGGWLVGSAVVFSYMQGTIHQYYTSALAPSVAATVAIGARALWATPTRPLHPARGLLRRRRAGTPVSGPATVGNQRTRDAFVARLFLAAAVAVSGWWAYDLLGRISWQGWLRVPVLVAGVGAAALVLYAGRQHPGADAGGPAFDPLAARRRARYAGAGVAALAGVGMLAGPAAYALDTVGTPHTGASPLAGPSGGRDDGPFGRGVPAGLTGQLDASRADQLGPVGGAGGQGGSGGRGGLGGLGRFGGSDGSRGQPFGMSGRGELPGGGQLPGPAPGGGIGGFGGFGGGFGGLAAPDENGGVAALLESGATKFRWVAAVSNSQSAASLELATGGDPVMAMGGFSGRDPAITLAQFQSYVSKGYLHYFVGGVSGGGFRGFGGGGGASGQITTWVTRNFAKVSLGGQTLYDLTKPTRAGTPG